MVYYLNGNSYLMFVFVLPQSLASIASRVRVSTVVSFRTRKYLLVEAFHGNFREK